MNRRVDNKAWFYLLPAGVIFVGVGFAPLMAVINYSFQDSFAGDYYFWVGLQWYDQMFSSSEFWGAVGRTFLFAALSLSIPFVLGIFVARKLFYRQKNPEVFIGIFALPLLTPWIVVGFLWRHAMHNQIGIIGVFGGWIGLPPDLNATFWVWATIILMDVWHWTSLTVILCYAGYLSIPSAFFQAAQIDAATGWSIFKYIEFPKLKNVLLIAILLRLADSLMIYTEPFMIARGGPHVSSTFLSQERIQTAMIEFNLGEAGAISVFYMLLMTLIAWLLFRAMRQ